MQSGINLIEVLSSMFKDYLKLGTDTLRKSISSALADIFRQLLTVMVVATLLLIALTVLSVGLTAFLTELTGHLGISALIVGAVYLASALILLTNQQNSLKGKQQ